MLGQRKLFRKGAFRVRELLLSDWGRAAYPIWPEMDRQRPSSIIGIFDNQARPILRSDATGNGYACLINNIEIVIQIGSIHRFCKALLRRFRPIKSGKICWGGGSPIASAIAILHAILRSILCMRHSRGKKDGGGNQYFSVSAEPNLNFIEDTQYV